MSDEKDYFPDFPILHHDWIFPEEWKNRAYVTPEEYTAWERSILDRADSKEVDVAATTTDNLGQALIRDVA